MLYFYCINKSNIMNTINKSKLFPLFFVLIFFCTVVKGQKNPVLIDSKKVIKEGIDFFDEGKFNDAKEKFLQVQFPDSNYYWAQYELSMVYLNDSLYDQAIDISRKSIEGGSTESAHYNIWGTSLDHQKKPEEAIEVYKKGISRYPYNDVLWFNLGIVYEGAKDYKNAIETYKKLLSFSPLSASTHLRLARICVQEGLYTQAILSYSMFLIIEPDSRRSLTVLVEFNNLCNGSLVDAGTEKNNALKQELEDIDLLVTNQVALNNKYKVPGKFGYAFVKQLYLIMDKISETPSPSPDYFSAFYVPVFKDIKKTNSFETLALLLLASSDNEDIMKQISKKKSEIITFREKCLKINSNNHSNYEVDLYGKKQILTNWYYKNLKINAFGNENVRKQNVGDWLYIDYNGSVKAMGHYSNEGLKTGMWTFWNENGDTLKTITYNNDKADGPYCIYKEGVRNEKGTYKNDLLDGDITEYFPDGSVSYTSKYVNDKRNGEVKKYFRIGTLKLENNFINDLADGLYKEYYPNTKLYKTSLIKEGKYDGNYKEYYEDGQLKKDADYKNGTFAGAYKTYFRNG
ncbi:MAG: hypothetical protein CVU05_13335, partial [Bacteroidetes bacterium HGW-Bacteroidetes-21]